MSNLSQQETGKAAFGLPRQHAGLDLLRARRDAGDGKDDGGDHADDGEALGSTDTNRESVV